jgi:hypothetical protein
MNMIIVNYQDSYFQCNLADLTVLDTLYHTCRSSIKSEYRIGGGRGGGVGGDMIWAYFDDF